MLQRVNDALLELERQTGVAAPHKRSITELEAPGHSASPPFRCPGSGARQAAR